MASPLSSPSSRLFASYRVLALLVGVLLAFCSLVALPLGRRKLKRRWGVLHWRGRRLSLAEETFVGLCESVAERIAHPPAAIS